MVAFVLLRLGRIYGDAELENRAVGVFRLAGPCLERAPTAVGQLLCALELHFAPPREVAVVGAAGGAPARAGPRRLPAEHRVRVRERRRAGATAVPLLDRQGPRGRAPAAYVCERFACQAPVTTYP